MPYRAELLGVVLEEIGPHTMAMRFSTISPTKAVNLEQAHQLEAALLELYAANPGQIFDFLIDGAHVSGTRFLSVEARQIYKRSYGLPQTGNVAFFGLGRWLKLMTTIFTNVLSRQASAQWFDTEAEALAWLQEKATQQGQALL